MYEINLTSPAKLNLFLNVLGKRKDGYYNVVTLLERINLSDKISLSYPSASTRILVNNYNVAQDRNNICYKAVSLFKRYTGIKDNINIEIKKNIPPGSGLGGGSSNAAFTLIGLNSLFNARLSFSTLVKIAKKIGVDVAFFLYNKSFALARGKGDEIYPVYKNWCIWHIIVKPDYSFSTKLSYKKLNLTSVCKKNANFLIEAIFNKNLDLLAKLLYNDFEQLYGKKVAKIKKILFDSGVKGAGLSGTGSGVFGIVSNRKEAYDVKRKLKFKKGWQVFVVRTL